MASEAEALSPEKQRQILQGAAAVFSKDGYEGASMARIAVEAAVSKGTLYNYFESKAELFAAYVRDECRRVLDFVFEETPGEPQADVAELLFGIGSRFLAVMMSSGGLVIFRMVVAEAGKFPELATIFYEAGPATGQRHLARWLARQTELGRLAIDDAEFAAEQFLQLCQTRIGLRCRLQMQGDVSEAQRDRVVRAAVDMFLRRYGPQVGGNP